MAAITSSLGIEGPVNAIHPWNTALSTLPASPHLHPQSHPHMTALSITHQELGADKRMFKDGMASGYTTPSEQEERCFSSHYAIEATGVVSESDTDNKAQFRLGMRDATVIDEIRTRSADDARTSDVSNCEFSQDLPSEDGRSCENSQLVNSRTHNQSRASHSRLSNSAWNIGSCDFSNTKSCQALLKLSEDVRSMRLLYHINTKCSSFVTKPFGPWCQKLSPKKAKQMFSTSNSSQNSRGGKESISPTKDRPSEKVVLRNLLKFAADQEKAAKIGNTKNPPHTLKEKNAKNADAEKNTKTSDVFDRLGGGKSSFVFRHRDDVRSYIAEYRESHTVGMIGRKSRRVPVLGVDLPDPYALKRKKPCVSVDSLSLTATPTGSMTPRATPAPEGYDVSKENISRDRPARAIPNLAPVRERRNTLIDFKGIPDKRQSKPYRKNDSTPTLLVLPSIRKAEDPQSLTLIGYTPPHHVTPPDNEPIARQNVACTNAVYYAGGESQCSETVANNDTSVTVNNSFTALARGSGKKGPVKLKYTTRLSQPDVTEMMQGTCSAVQTPRSQAKSSRTQTPVDKNAHTSSDNSNQCQNLVHPQTSTHDQSGNHLLPSKDAHDQSKSGLHAPNESDDQQQKGLRFGTGNENQAKKHSRARQENDDQTLESAPENGRLVAFSVAQAVMASKNASSKVTAIESSNKEMPDLYLSAQDRMALTASVDRGLEQLKRHHEHNAGRDGRRSVRLKQRHVRNDVSTRIVMSVDNLPDAMRAHTSMLPVQHFKVMDQSKGYFMQNSSLHFDLNLNFAQDIGHDVDARHAARDKLQRENTLSLWNTGVAATTVTEPETKTSPPNTSVFPSPLFSHAAGGKSDDGNVRSNYSDRDRAAQIKTGPMFSRKSNPTNSAQDDKQNSTTIKHARKSPTSEANSPDTASDFVSLGVRGKTIVETSPGLAFSETGGSQTKTVAEKSLHLAGPPQQAVATNLSSPRHPQKEIVRLAMTRTREKLSRLPSQQQQKHATFCTRKSAAINPLAHAATGTVHSTSGCMHKGGNSNGASGSKEVKLKRHGSRSDGAVTSPGHLVVHGGACDAGHVTRTDVITAHAHGIYNGEENEYADNVVPVKVEYRLPRAEEVESRNKRDHFAAVS